MKRNLQHKYSYQNPNLFENDKFNQLEKETPLTFTKRIFRDLTNDSTNTKKTLDFDQLKKESVTSPIFSPTPIELVSPIKKIDHSIDLDNLDQTNIVLQNFNTSRENSQNIKSQFFYSLITWENQQLSGSVFFIGCFFLFFGIMGYSTLNALCNLLMMTILLGTVYSKVSWVYFRFFPSEKKVENFFTFPSIHIVEELIELVNSGISFMKGLIWGEDFVQSIVSVLVAYVVKYFANIIGWYAVFFIVYVFLFTYPLLITPEYLAVVQDYCSRGMSAVWSVGMMGYQSIMGKK